MQGGDLSSEGRPRSPYIGRRTRVFEVGGPRVQVRYNMENYLYGFQIVSCDIWAGGHRRAASCVLSCTPSLEDASRLVDKVFWVYMLVGESSSRSGPLGRDLLDSDRWESLGTHVSQVTTLRAGTETVACDHHAEQGSDLGERL
jgi:hypothetical protein